MNKVYMNVSDLFGNRELPQGEVRLRRSKAAEIVLIITAIMTAAIGVFAYSDGSEGRIAAVICAVCVVICVVCAVFAKGADITLTAEGVVIKRGGEDTLYPYNEVLWYEYNTGSSVALHFNDCTKAYNGQDCRLLTGALRAAGVPSYDPDDPDKGPECIAVKHTAGRKVAAIGLLITAAVIWACLLVPGLDAEAKWILVVTCGVSTVLLAAVAFMIWRQRIEMYEDGFRIRGAIGGFREYRYDEFASRTVRRVRSRSSAGSLDMVIYNVYLYTNAGRKVVIKSSLLMPELLERIGFDLLPYREG